MISKRYLCVCALMLGLALCLAGCQLPAQGSADFQAGLKALERQNPDLAIDVFTRALNQGNLSVETKTLAYYNRGIAHSHLGNLPQALADFDQALLLDANLVPAYNNRGMVLYRLSQHDKAVADLDTAIRLDPQSAIAYYNRSFPLAAQGKDKQAIADLQQALRLSPDNEVYRNRLNALSRPEQRLPKPGPGAGLGGGKSSGSGFVVSPQGHVLTNLHVIKDAREIRVPGLDKPLAVRALDAATDLALLQMPAESDKVAAFAVGRAPRAGESVVVLGFPLAGLLASGPSVSTGTIAALAGLGNNPHLLQITAPVQPGNSGGPLLDETGGVIGVVMGKLNIEKLASLTGVSPQNVNFAISGSTARGFLEANGVTVRPAPATASALSPADIAERAAGFVVLLECIR